MKDLVFERSSGSTNTSSACVHSDKFLLVFVFVFVFVHICICIFWKRRPRSTLVKTNKWNFEWLLLLLLGGEAEARALFANVTHI